ncbi:hypothetical protein BT63DRAFT_421110 [Microthyrium microscopicum]|uniref:Uncharacterized protein n=1 Tax=Microthyrium microscopicum TaxID=703497 RepID=A0A6A6UPS9_9PEZI|nr:hypothetical protein BT63DRAFT_421110 [Microthyrium microscopicum]
MYQLGWGRLNINGQFANGLRWNNLQSNVVGLLAILGEGAVTSTSQVATLSRMIYLPRLLPAPQALLLPSRQNNLSPIPGQVVGVSSGNFRPYVNFLGHILLTAESLPEYAVKCIRIQRVNSKREIKARTYGPTWWVAVLGCVLSLILLGIGVWQRDGMAILADISLSLLSTLVGVTNKWRLKLPKRAGERNHWTPPGDVVIRYPKGSFIIVRCTEDVARELYFAPEGIDYHMQQPYKHRITALISSIILMFSVLFLSNAGTNSQVAFAVSYLILNAAYWTIAALPQNFHWDTSAFQVSPEAFNEAPTPVAKNLLKDSGHSRTKRSARNRSKRPPEPGCREHYVSYNETFTEALWKVIIATREIDWVRRSKAAPMSEAWDQWLNIALQVARDAPQPTLKDVKLGDRVEVVQFYNIPDWNARSALQLAMLQSSRKE